MIKGTKKIFSSKKTKKVVEIFLILTLGIIFILFIALMVDGYTGGNVCIDEYEMTQEEVEEERVCNVIGAELYGEIKTYISNEELDIDGYRLYDQSVSNDITLVINDSNNDDNIKAVLIEVDSYGGSLAAAEEINDAIKHSKKPVIAYIREAGLSAAYYSISGVSHIIALSTSDIGSIGVTMSYVDNSQKNIKEGLTFNQLSTGKFKNIGDRDKSLTYEEKQLLMRDLNILNEIFMKTVSKNRGIELDKVKKMADGSSMPGQMALENKLIDQIGTIYDVKNYIKELIGEDVEICW